MAETSKKKVLILGAGLVTKPAVRYLAKHGFAVTVASRTVSKAEALIEGLEGGSAKQFLINDVAALKELVGGHDLTVSLLPAAHHVKVARACLEKRRPMVTTSYVKPEMWELDKEARAAGVALLNELGVDPGIDHMSAMKVIDEVADKGGKVVGFKSYCGGLPAPDAKTTPWGYKFSWSPRGVVLAGTNSARYLKDGEVVEIPGKDLFGHSWEVDVPEARTFEAYPNRDSLPYKDLYGLGDARTMLRGTLRYPGWCETWKAMVDLGLLSLEERDDLGGQTYRELMASLVPGAEVESVEKDVADHLGIDMESEPMLRWRWLGLFSDDKVDPEPTLLDVLSHRLLQKLEYGPGERDMIVLHHDFDVELADGKKKITSSLIDYGVPGGDSAMSRTVSLPAAIAVRLVLEGKLDVVGVHIPVKRSIYEPVLEELETLGIRCREEEQPA